MRADITSCVQAAAALGAAKGVRGGSSISLKASSLPRARVIGPRRSSARVHSHRATGLHANSSGAHIVTSENTLGIVSFSLSLADRPSVPAKLRWPREKNDANAASSASSCTDSRASYAY